MEVQTHVAAQYLATANKSFVVAKSDDSHTNVGFDPEMLTLTTHPLAQDGVLLEFNYPSFRLEWSSPTGRDVFPLSGKHHKAVVQWLKEKAIATLNLEYSFDLHYELPYSIDDHYIFSDADPKELKRLADLRVLAQHSLEAVANQYKLVSDIRIWPHHFDTGGYAPLPNTNLYVGFGLAIPDSVCDDHYFYLSAYQNNTMVSTQGFSSLPQGTWLNKGFKGAILPAGGCKEEKVISFYKEAINGYIRLA